METREDRIDELAVSVGLEAPSDRPKTVDKLFPDRWPEWIEELGEEQAKKEIHRRTGRTTTMTLGAVADMLEDEDLIPVFVTPFLSGAEYIKWRILSLSEELGEVNPRLDLRSRRMFFTTKHTLEQTIRGLENCKIYRDHTMDEF